MIYSLRSGGTFMVGMLMAAPLTAQHSPPSPSTFAITGARLVTLAGPAIENGTLVIRNGLITAVGASASVPVDARLIDGSGLTVYPGLIDPFTSLGFAPPASAAGNNANPAGGRGGRGGAAPTGSTPTEAALSGYPLGFQPEKQAIDQLAANANFDAAHSAGFTTALTLPSSGAFRGSAAVINLRNAAPAAIVLRSGVAQGLSFSRGSGGGYPSSLMGVISQLRQELLDAQHYRELTQAYAKAPLGMARPVSDASLEALQPVISGEIPVIMVANNQQEINRALDLAEEFHLKMIIAGGSEAYRVADRLKSLAVPVLYSTAFSSGGGRGGNSLQALRDQVQAPRTPGVFARAGLMFAFTAGSNWADYLGNVRAAVENGLLVEHALEAMITTPAEMFGVADRVGSLEPGKIANLTLMRGDLFDRNATVASLFIDGEPVEISQSPAAATGGRGGRGGRGGVEVKLDQDGRMR